MISIFYEKLERWLQLAFFTYKNLKVLTNFTYEYIIRIGNGETTNVVLPRIYENSHQLVKVTDVSLFIYVVAYQPSSYIELLSRQRLMLKIILGILLNIVPL